MMLITWIQDYENLGEAEAQRAPSSAAFPVCYAQERAAASLSAPAGMSKLVPDDLSLTACCEPDVPGENISLWGCYPDMLAASEW